MKRILLFSAALLAAGLSMMPDEASAQRGGWGGRGGGGFGGGGGWRGGGGGRVAMGGGYRGGFGGGYRGGFRGGGWGGHGFRSAGFHRGYHPGLGRGWRGGGYAYRPWRRHYGYGGYPYWGVGTGFVAGAAFGAAPYYGYGPAFYEPEPECVEVRRRIWTGRAYVVRIETHCS